MEPTLEAGCDVASGLVGNVTGPLQWSPAPRPGATRACRRRWGPSTRCNGARPGGRVQLGDRELTAERPLAALEPARRPGATRLGNVLGIWIPHAAMEPDLEAGCDAKSVRSRTSGP